MNSDKQNRTSHLFLVRFWLEGKTEEANTHSSPDWQGNVQHVVTGRAGRFDSQASMVQLLTSMLSLSNSANGERGERGEHSDGTNPIAPYYGAQGTETDTGE